MGFETLGNATLAFHEGERVVLATDPWLKGTCYCGSWALDRPLTDAELKSVVEADYIWISHGHPDHFHPPSLELLPKGKKILLPDFYAPDMRAYLEKRGFNVEVLRYRQWKQLSPRIRCLCLDNENQDAILLIEAGDSLVLDLNDSPLCGEARFIRKQVRRHDRAKTYAAALYSNDADMFNLVDAQGRRVIDAPRQRKKGMVWSRARIADGLGVGAYVGSASQHIYVRSDSVWANPYRVTWDDVLSHWTRPHIRLIEPFVILDLETGEYQRKHPTQTSDESQITDTNNGDDWNERLSEEEWAALSAFFHKIESLRRHLDHLDFTVGGERRTIWQGPAVRRKDATRQRSINFCAPRRSLMKTIKHGYFDDILIGNFMTAELRNVGLYPHFTPIVAKLAGAAKVRSAAAARNFKWHYFKRNPLGYLEWHMEQGIEGLTERLRHLSDVLGLKRPLKHVYRRLLGDPVD